MEKPTVYLLCGLTGSGKTTYAKNLEEQGVVRLSLDEGVFNIHGKYGKDYPHEKHLELEEKIREELDEQLVQLLANGKNVVLDYGFWAKDSRTKYKNLINQHNGITKLLYFKTSPELLLKRLKERNERIDANSLPVDESMLKGFIERFEEPNGETEIIISQEAKVA